MHSTNSTVSKSCECACLVRVLATDFDGDLTVFVTEFARYEYT